MLNNSKVLCSQMVLIWELYHLSKYFIIVSAGFIEYFLYVYGILLSFKGKLNSYFN